METKNLKQEPFDVSEAINAQTEYCERTKAPFFAPRSGRCWKCGNNIYIPIEKHGRTTGVTVEKAGKELITGCPHCNTTFCD
ncbi:hypothetical protein [Bacteroides neonati]|uniref:hypothetical protein n=1 Tax=Bacteroides neonati TaxID=1347393 RepID=UPI0004BB2F1E|nr:hypothetical protein [Bacteroides neonati]